MIFDYNQCLTALLGGGLIGLSVSLMLYFNGRVTGISGIFAGIFNLRFSENLWKIMFIIGLILGGLVLNITYPETFKNNLDFSHLRIAIAGLLVGFGTRLGSGCTSGHGVCGISRFSKRSIVATSIFILTGVLTVILFGGQK